MSTHCVYNTDTDTDTTTTTAITTTTTTTTSPKTMTYYDQLSKKFTVQVLLNLTSETAGLEISSQI